MKEVDYRIEEKVIVDCPDCGYQHTEVLFDGEFTEDMSFICKCGCVFILGDEKELNSG